MRALKVVEQIAEPEVAEAESWNGRLQMALLASNGIAKLRELILELAIQGKLVPQITKDEPIASFINKHLTTKKDDFEISDSLPSSWIRIKSSALFKLRKGKNPKNLSTSKIGDPYLDIDALDRNNIKRYSEDPAAIRCKSGDILVVCDGSRSGLILNGQDGIVGSTLAVIDCHEDLKEYIKLIFMKLYTELNNNMKGAAIPHLDTARLRKSFVDLPPIAEQKRIIQRVNELMALCDTLESQKTDAATAHETLVKTLLDTLTQSQSAKEFQENWQRIVDNFNILFTTEASIDALKQTILQLAVMGKLVPQNPKDESADAFLKRISIATSRVKTSKKKTVSSTTENEQPYNLPKNWKWVTFSQIGELARGKSKHRPRNDRSLFIDGKYPLVQTGDVARADGVIKTYKSLYNEKGLAQSRMWPQGTMCITIAANIADTAILGMDACFPDSVVGFLPFDKCIDVRFYDYFVKTAKSHLEDYAPSTAQKNINLEILGQLSIPLPPPAEISRIVSKVNELMAVCDNLKADLSKFNSIHQELASALVEKAIAA